MTEFKLVKPAGFDLRAKRADKQESALHWKAQDALFEASEDIANQNVDAAIICWRETHADGSTSTHFRYAGPEGGGTQLLLTTLGRFMGWK